MPRTTRTVQNEILLEAALEGLELRRQRLEEEIQHVRSLLGRRGRGRSHSENHETVAAEASPKRRLNPEARKRIAAAQRKRWEEYRKKQASQRPHVATKKRHSSSRRKPASPKDETVSQS
jgi:hypothetical protein